MTPLETHERKTYTWRLGAHMIHRASVNGVLEPNIKIEKISSTTPQYICIKQRQLPELIEALQECLNLE